MSAKNSRSRLRDFRGTCAMLCQMGFQLASVGLKKFPIKERNKMKLQNVKSAL